MKLKNRLGFDLFNSTAGNSLLARTFRQVVLQRMLSFKLVLYAPGVVRNMADLTNSEKVKNTSLLTFECHIFVSVTS